MYRRYLKLTCYTVQLGKSNTYRTLSEKTDFEEKAAEVLRIHLCVPS